MLTHRFKRQNKPQAGYIKRKKPPGHIKVKTSEI